MKDIDVDKVELVCAPYVAIVAIIPNIDVDKVELV
jgi:hypothetical protein